MKRLIPIFALLALLPLYMAAETPQKPEAWGDDVPYVIYPVTHATFYGSGIDWKHEWNPCTGSTDGGVEIHLTQKILPIQNCPGEYVVVRVYTDRNGNELRRTHKRLSACGSVPV